MSVAKVIRSRRLELGLSDVLMATELGLSISALGDIELHDDELESAVPLGTVRHLCALLRLPLSEVLRLPIDEGVRNGRLARELMRQSRERMGYSEMDLGDRIGFDENTIKSLEAKSSFADTLPVFVFRELEHVLELPEGTLVLGDWR